MALTTLSICSGIGGIELGLQLVIPIRVLAYVEREAYAAAALLARMEDESLESAPVFCGNVEDFDASDFEGVDLVTAGLPCQPYSAAGQQKGDEDERAIWPEFIRIIGECRPAMVFLENVPTFVTRGWFRRPGGELSRLGYRIERPLFLAASDLGATHIRERVWILAIAAISRRNQGRCEARREIWDEARREESQRRHSDLADAANYNGGCGECGTQDGIGKDGERGGRSSSERVELGDTEKQGLEGNRMRWRLQPPFPWPPGPSDLARWAEVPEALEPAFCKLADGDADRLGRQRASADRLRCLGNAVCVPCAGFAFAYLAREAGLLND